MTIIEKEDYESQLKKVDKVRSLYFNVSTHFNGHIPEPLETKLFKYFDAHVDKLIELDKDYK